MGIKEGWNEKIRTISGMGWYEKRSYLPCVVGNCFVDQYFLTFYHYHLTHHGWPLCFCGIPIILEAVIGLVSAFDIKADVLVSLALIASIVIGENFAAGEVAFIMQLGALLEDLTVAKARAGIEKLVHLTPGTARVIQGGGRDRGSL